MPQLSRYATDPREGDCVRLLPRFPRRRALFLGNALALLPTILTDLFESVTVADWNRHRVALAEQRREDEAIQNLACVATTGTDDVPGRLGPFDLVVLGEEGPDTRWLLPFADRDASRRLADGIAAGGCLMYGVRFPRSGPLRRALALQSRGGAPMLYPAHARLLAAAGFSAVRAYGRRPDTRPYQVYVPLDEPEAVGYWIDNGRRRGGIRPRLARALKDVLVGVGAQHHLFNNFLVIARRDP